jgi:hypothetical protein
LLFPDEALNTKISEIRKSKELDQGVVQKFYEFHGLNRNYGDILELYKYLNSHGYYIKNKDSEFALNEAELCFIAKECEKIELLINEKVKIRNASDSI